MTKLILHFFIIGSFLITSCSHRQVSSNDSRGNAPRENEDPVVDPAWTGQTLVNNVSPDSKSIGPTELVLGPVDKNSAYKKMGLKEGDVIKSWNGKKMSRRQDWDFIKDSLGTAKTFRIVIERDGREKVINYAPR